MVPLCPLRTMSTTHMVACVLCVIPRNNSVSRHGLPLHFRVVQKTGALQSGPFLSVAENELAVSLV
jgi:hypothetical protein